LAEAFCVRSQGKREKEPRTGKSLKNTYEEGGVRGQKRAQPAAPLGSLKFKMRTEKGKRCWQRKKLQDGGGN